jgi:hypothetical protein
MGNVSPEGNGSSNDREHSLGESTRWADLKPEPGIVDALDHAGTRPPDTAERKARHAWSDLFADGCAVALAAAFRKTPLAKKKRKKILPESIEKGTEPVTPLGSGTKKRIDVTVADAVLGLEIGVSLKGLNFKDGTGLNYDKNLTGRLYELGDEVRLVHEHLPHCFMVGVFFLPVESTDDKRSKISLSSFAHTVIKLRGRTGRLDVALGAQSMRCDASFVGLYATGDEGLPRGTVRFFDTSSPPPKRGRPRVSDTVSLSELAVAIVARATFSMINIEWGRSESDLGAAEEPPEPVAPSELEELLDLEELPDSEAEQDDPGKES